MAGSTGRGRGAKGGGSGDAAGASTAGGAEGASAAAGQGMPLRAVLPSVYGAGAEVQQQILDAAEKLGYQAQSLFAIKIAVEEALVNAIKHGNRLDPSKRVTVEASISADTAEITVEDEGPGFDRSSVPDPLAEENLEKPSGRGILLIESYMTEVSWDRGGRRLRMVKRPNDQGPGCVAVDDSDVT